LENHSTIEKCTEKTLEDEKKEMKSNKLSKNEIKMFHIRAGGGQPAQWRP